MSSITNSDIQSDWEIEKRCINIAFVVGGPLFIYGLVAGTAAHMVAGAVLYSSSLIATAIRDAGRKA